MTRWRNALISAALGLCGLLAWAPAAGATTATATFTAGTLGFVNSTPGSVTFSGALTGADQSFTTTQVFDVGDATGSGAGWNITATSTTFTASSHTLSTSATTVAGAPTVACDASTTCTTATNAVTFPYTLPAAATAPTATKLFNAAINTGMGDQTVTPTWHLAVPASTYAATYNSTWTLSLVSAP